jgi:hypothetical protein
VTSGPYPLPTAPTDATCSFCGKKRGEPVSDFRPDPVRYIVQGPLVTICDACILLCVEILEDNGIEAWPAETP